MKITKLLVASLSFAAIIALSGCATKPSTSPTASSDTVLETYANIAYLNYKDSLSDAKKLEAAIDRFTKNPTEETMSTAKAVWLQSRESYGQTEVFRF